MKSPSLSGPYPDRHIDCQEAIEESMIAVLDEGASAGWSRQELAAAIIDLADNIMLADAANREVDKDIAAALRRIGL
jgi:hypothetical protein